MRTQQGLEGGEPLPGDSRGSIGSGSSGLSPGSQSDRGSPVSPVMDGMVDGGLGVGACMGGGRGGGDSLGSTLRGVLSRYWSSESLHSTTGKGLAYMTRLQCPFTADKQFAD